MANTTSPANEAAAPTRSVHTFHIPVMGIGFTIDTPVRVAKYGISSVISLVDDVLIEQMRKHHCEQANEPYEEITDKDEDPRAHRITAYLNLLDRLLQRQVRDLQASPFEPGSEITRYYKLLPESPLKQAYRDMLSETDADQKEQMQEALRRQAVPGSIDVNIMTKLDRDRYLNGEKLPRRLGDALSALRGYAQSTLQSAIVFSAGLNTHLYSYSTEFADFFPDAYGNLKKKIILKVSDYRSAVTQGKFLAKRGLWISEYRIESGLNCGGHAFSSKGYLLGPILEEFKKQKHQLFDKVSAIYSKALEASGHCWTKPPAKPLITVQGGIGVAEEDQLCLEHFGADGTGWATPFLLVPEVANLDEEHMRKLEIAGEEDVFLSDSSTLGIPFWNLRGSASEEARRERIAQGKPGSPCPKGYTKFNTEFTKEPICIASRNYQKRKLAQVEEADMSEEHRAASKEYTLAKSCICHDLGGGVKIVNHIEPESKPAVCCGMSIIDFSKIATLEEMVGHIYGRLSLLTNSNRPHMFIRELKINIDHLRKEMEKVSLNLSTCTPKYFEEFKENLLIGIESYKRLAEVFIEEKKTGFLNDLKKLQEELEQITRMLLV